MPSGRFGNADLQANTDVDLYTVPVGTVATANINLCNRSESPVRARIAIRSGALGSAHYLEYDALIPPNGVLGQTGVAMSPGEIITVRASAAGVSARAHGFEEAL
ncbi:MAG: hypothetical protein Q4G62_01625 [Pseudomonadota bacterium]|nr:hypothetical protein [Pseudomonadota bacterium]